MCVCVCAGDDNLPGAPLSAHPISSSPQQVHGVFYECQDAFAKCPLDGPNCAMLEEGYPLVSLKIFEALYKFCLRYAFDVLELTSLCSWLRVPGPRKFTGRIVRLLWQVQTPTRRKRRGSRIAFDGQRLLLERRVKICSPKYRGQPLVGSLSNKDAARFKTLRACQNMLISPDERALVTRQPKSGVLFDTKRRVFSACRVVLDTLCKLSCQFWSRKLFWCSNLRLVIASCG